MTAIRPFMAFLAKEVQLQRRDPTALVILFFAPLVLIVFLSDALAPGEAARPYDESVPRFTIMFALFAAGFTAMGFHRERTWGTWDRLLSLPTGRRHVVLGKTAPIVGIVVIQGVVLLFGGALVFGIPVHNPAMLIVGSALTGATAAALGLVIAVVATTDQQIQQLNNVLALLLGALGGALAPLSAMPGWAQTVAPAVPQYWAVDLLTGAMAGGAPPSRLLLDAGVLCLFIAGLCSVALPWIHGPRDRR
jgi:ABC-2 type transport system permease protein